MNAKEEVVNIQLKSMIKSGIPLEDACQVLNLDFEAAKLYLSGDLGVEEDVDELIKKYKPKLVTLLYNIACDASIENVAARVSAARTIVEGKGEIPEFSVDKLSEMYRKMRGIVEKAENSSSTISNPNPSTTIVDVKMIPMKENVNNKN